MKTYCTCIEDDDGHTTEMCEDCAEALFNEAEPGRKERIWREVVTNNPNMR
jgi:hypothetical protein